MIVTVTPTIMDGAVVRWYVNKTAFDCGAEKVSASRNGVIVSGYLHEVPPDVLDAAQTVYVNLRRDPRADVSRYATHSRRGLFGQLEPVASRSPSTESETPQP